MKILLISNFFPPSHTAGTEKRTFGYASRLLLRGHEARVICAGRWSEGRGYLNGFDDEIYRQVPVRRIHLNWMRAPDPNAFLYRNPVLRNHVGQFMASWAPDAVHITSCLTMSGSMIEAAKSLRLPVLLTLTDFWFICPRVTLLRGDGSLCDGRTTDWDCLKCLLWRTKAYRGLCRVAPERLVRKLLLYVGSHSVLNRWRGLRGMAMNIRERKSYLLRMLEAVDEITAPSSRLAGAIRESGVKKPIRVLHSGHDLDWLSNLPEKKPSARIRIGYIGQVIEIKGVDTLISAFLAGSIKEKARLALYGDRDADAGYRERLNALTAGNEEAVRFHGPFPHESLGAILSVIDVLVVPSRWHENNPRVIQEAFASGTPVIGSNVGGISEFVHHEKNGLLFERNNIADLACQLQRIVANPGLLNKLRDGIQRVKTIDEEVDEIEAIYSRLVSEKESRAVRE